MALSILAADSVPFVLENHVKVKNLDDLLRKLTILKNDGAGNLQIITDYDLTITKHHINGKLTESSFGLFALCKSTPQEFLKKSRALGEKYYPIEKDPNRTSDEKTPYMVEWYSESQSMFDGLVLVKGELEELAHSESTALRDGTKEMLRLLQQHNVPTLVLSAGLGDVIRTVLNEHDIKESELFHIVSNFFEVTDGTIKGFSCLDNGKFLHPFNKNAFGCIDYFKNVGHSRGNVIVMGDTVGDAQMSDGVPMLQNTIKIGFLYGTESHVQSALPQFLNFFDIVLIDDQSMRIPRLLLDLILPSCEYFMNSLYNIVDIGVIVPRNKIPRAVAHSMSKAWYTWTIRTPVTR